MKKIFFWKQEGDLGFSTMLLNIAMIYMFFLLTIYILEGRQIRLIVNGLKTGIELTNLSSPRVDEQSVIDSQFYSMRYDSDTGSYIYIDVAGNEIFVELLPQDTYENFCELVTQNVTAQLSGAGLSNFFVDKMEIYNVDSAGNITVYSFDSEGDCAQAVYSGAAGSFRAPNGVYVYRTSIYSEVRFDYEDMFGQEHNDLSVKNCTCVRALWQ